MGLEVRRTSSRKVRVISTLIAVFALLVQPLVSLNVPSAFASAPVSVSSASADKDHTYRSAVVDGSQYSDLTFSFVYDSSSLDANPNPDSFSYGWSVGGVDHPIGSVVNGVAGNDATEINQSVSEHLPSAALVSGLSVYVKVAANTPSDHVDLTNVKLEGTDVPVAQLNAEEFAAVDNNSGSYKGVSVGFNAKDFGTVSAVTVDVTRADGSHVIKHGNAGLFDLISHKTATVQLTAPIVIQEGAYTEASDTANWTPAPATWTATTKPVSVKISVTDENGTKTVTNNSFSEGAPSWPSYSSLYPVDTSNITFVLSPKYVRANNSGDVAAQVHVDNRATAVNFYIDGDTSTPVAGTYIDHVNGQLDRWRLKTPLAPGVHTISAKAQINGDWYDANNTGTAYSIDAPTAQYVVPTAGQYFRPNDLVARVRADDEFDQFDHMVTTINGVAHTVSRADCSDKGDYVFCDLKNLNLPDGTYTATTTTYTKANNRVDNLVSQSFTIDSFPPTTLLNGIQEAATNGYYGAAVHVITWVDDAGSGVDEVKVYATEPRSDGQCDPNETKVIDSTVASALIPGMVYSTALDTSSLNGTYCFFAVAGDKAGNHSNPQTDKFSAKFDNAGPTTPQITTPDDGDYFKTSSISTEWTASTDAGVGFDHYEIEYRYTQNGSPVVVTRTETTNHRNQTLSGSVQGPFTIRVRAFDKFGNASDWSDSVTYTFDSIAPTVSVPTDSGQVTGNSLALNGTVSDDNLDYYSYQILDSNKADTLGSIGGPRQGGTSPVTNGLLANVDLTGLSEGTYYIRVWASDKAGNSTGTNPANYIYTKFVIDHSGPTLTVDKPVSVRSGETATLSGTTDDPAALITVKIDGIPYPGVVVSGNVWSLTVDTTKLTVGQYSVSVSSVDAYGNVGAPVLATLVIASPDTSDGELSRPSAGPLSTHLRTSTSTRVNTPAVTTSDATDDTAVLGTKDSADSDTPAKNTAAIVTPSSQGWKILGMAWYWWLLILAVIVGLWWLLVARRRRANEAA